MKRLFSIIAAALVLTGICASAQDDPLGRCLLLNERGSILMDEGRFPEAADAYRKALSLYPAWADSVGRIIIMHNFVDALSSQGAISEAVRVLDALEGVSLEGELGLEMQNLRANTLAVSGRKTEALQIWKGLLKKAGASPNFPLYARNAAEAALGEGETLWVESTLGRALDRAKTPLDSIEIYRLAALNAIEAGEKETARIKFYRAEKVACRHYTDGEYQMLLLLWAKARILEAEGLFEEAASTYEDVSRSLSGLLGEQHPAVFSAIYGKARSLLGCGKGQEAVKSYLEYSAMKKEYLGREVAGLNPLDLRGFWTRNREGVVDAPLFAGVADDASMGKVLDMVLLSKSFTYDCTREVTTSPSWADVAKRLPPSAVAIEFADYTGLDGVGHSCAFVYRNGADAPRFVPLPSAFNFVWKPSAADEKDLKALYEAVWAPLKEFIRPSDTVYFSPSAALSVLPMEYAIDPAGTIFSKTVSLAVRVLTTRDIPRIKADAPLKQAVLFGDMKYDQVPQRGRLLYWPDLKWSRYELDLVTSVLRDIPCMEFSGEKATESAFRNCCPADGADALLYLSTHGLYLDAHLASQFSYYNKRYDRRVLEDNPLLRSVIVFSGATKFWFSDTPVGENEDETISAQEISEMDLSGVSLAVLAACETGLSDSDPEILGFPRAFRLAGANASVVSLWTVDDQVTANLLSWMVLAVADGKTPEDALRMAADEIRQTHPLPYYWAPFVVMR